MHPTAAFPDYTCYMKSRLNKRWVRSAGSSQAPIAILPPFSAGVTSVAFAGRADGLSEGSHLLAVGLETGSVQVWSFRVDPLHFSQESPAIEMDSPVGGDGVGTLSVDDVRLQWVPPHHDRHSAAVRRLCWRTEGPRLLQLASCSDDHAVRVWDMTLASDQR